MILFRFQRITRRQGGGDEAYFTHVTFRSYVEEANDAANKVSQRKRNGILTILKKTLLCQGNIGAIRCCLHVVYFRHIIFDLPETGQHPRPD
jgi:hypothetical protein